MQNIRPLIVKSRLCACEINGHYTGGRRPHVLSRHCAQVPGADRGGAAVLVLAEPVGLRHGLLRAHPGKLGPFPRRTVPSPRYVSFCLQLFFRVRACARNAVVSCLPLHLPRRGESTHDRGGVGVDQSRTWKHASVRMGLRGAFVWIKSHVEACERANVHNFKAEGLPSQPSRAHHTRPSCARTQ